MDASSGFIRRLLCTWRTRFFMVISDGSNYASMSMLVALVTGSLLYLFGIQSFKHSRKALVAEVLMSDKPLIIDVVDNGGHGLTVSGACLDT